MLKQTSENFKEIFIFEFTKELIKSTQKYKEELVKNEVKRILQKKLEIRQESPVIEKKEIKDIVKEKLSSEKKKISQLKEDDEFPWPEFRFIRKPLVKKTHPIQIIKSEPVFKKHLIRKPTLAQPTRPFAPSPLYSPGFSIAPLRIPEPHLPETVRDIRPTPTNREIDLGKLNPLINDSLVKTIEYSGVNDKIIVTGGMGRKSTAISLTKEEADEIVNRFSYASRIPVHEGFFRVALGRLILSAVISNVESIGSKFIITKLPVSSIHSIPSPYKR